MVRFNPDTGQVETWEDGDPVGEPETFDVVLEVLEGELVGR